MRKALLITTIFLLLTLTLTQLAAADFTVTNDSNTKVKVIYVYFDPSQEAFRIKGYYHINPGKSKRLKVPDEVDQVVARIWTASEVVAHDRPLYWTWAVHPRKAFEVVYKHEERVVLQSNVPREELMASADFYDYANNTTFTYQPGNGSVNIFNFFLRDAITDELGKARGTKITPADMLRLQRLGYGGYSKIHVLTGLEFATNLTDLHLGGDYISDISSLTGLTNLEKLRLEVNKISDVSPLANLKNLKILWLYGNEISDLSPLAGLTNLEELLLYGNEISDVSPLANLKNLKNLHLNQNQISDLSPLIGLTNLPYLSLQSNEISDVSPLANLKNLKGLDLRRNKISDFSPIAGLIPNLARYENSNQDVPADDVMAEDTSAGDGGDGMSEGDAEDISQPVNIPDAGLRSAIEHELGKTPGATITRSDMLTLTKFEARERGIQNLTGLEFATNLEELSPWNNQITDISPLAGLTNLTTVHLSRNQISDVSPLANLKNLIELNLWNNQITDISPLAGLTNLTTVYLSSNQISDVSPLANLKNLTNLDLEYNQISDVSPLANLKNLIELDLWYNRRISDVSPLASLKNLTNLDLGVNQISDVSPLANLKNLIELNLYGNQSSDVSPLASLKNLMVLYLFSNQISDVSPLASLKNLTNLDLEYNQISDISPLTQLKNLISLDLSYNQISDVSPLAGLTKLTHLYLNKNQISDFSPIAGLLPNLVEYTKDDQDVPADDAMAEDTSADDGGDGMSDGDAQDVSQPVNIPDVGLRSAIEEALGKTSGATISPADMRTLTELDAREQDIQDITGLEFATNLTALYLNENEISDVSALIQLKELRTLWLYVNQISDIAALAQLTNLTSLSLSHNQLSDVSALANLKRLKTLWIDGNQISDIAALAQLTDMRELSLPDNQISDVSPLVELKNLTRLHLVNNHISDVSPLAGLTNLRELYLSKNKISDFSPIAGLIPNLKVYENSDQRLLIVHIPDPNLRAAIEEQLGKAQGTPITQAEMQTLTQLDARKRGIQDLIGIEFATNLEDLYLFGNEISDISPLAQLKSLGHLYLSENEISDISPLAQLSELRDLGLGTNQISDFSPLAELKQLWGLDIRKSQISDISPLTQLNELTHLYLSDNQISDISPLTQLNKLTWVDLSDNQISDISPLVALKQLGGVNLADNQISDISPLAELKNLTRLFLWRNQISDISPLAELKQLEEYLNLADNQISDISPLAGLNKLTRLSLWGNQISDVSPLAGLKNLTHLHISINQISDVSPLAGLKNLIELKLTNNQISDFTPIAGLVKNLEVYENSPQLKSRIPNSVEISGPTTVPSVVKDYRFTATVKNDGSQVLGNFEVTVNGKDTVQTNAFGVAEFKLNFPSVGTHHINLTVRDKESVTEFQQHFPNRVEVLKPDSIEIVRDFREIEEKTFYTADFVVRSADGQALEGFQVKLNVGKWVFETIGTAQVPIPDVLRATPNVTELLRDDDANSRIHDLDVFGWRVKSVASDRFNTAITDGEGRVVCSQRLFSTGFYGVSATVILNGQGLLTTSFSAGDAPNMKIIHPGRTLSIDDANTFYRVPGGWKLLKLRGGFFPFHAGDILKNPPVDPPSYRVKVIPSQDCEVTVPSQKVLATAEKLETAFVAVRVPSLFSSTSGVEEAYPDVTPSNSTTSLDRKVRWRPATTLTKDIGVTVITVRFLDGTDTQIETVKKAFYEWQSTAPAKVYFIYSEGEEHADIRVTFGEKNKPTAGPGTTIHGRSDIGPKEWMEKANDILTSRQSGGFWDALGAAVFDWVGYESQWAKLLRQVATEIQNVQDMNTMWLETDFTYGTALHEIGHALGFYHPHHTSVFAKTFKEWPPPESKRPSNITDAIVETDGEPAVDQYSIMTYEIDPDLLIPRAGARSDLKEVAETGISKQRNTLSPGDKKALANVYGRRPYNGWQPVHLTGTLGIYGVDDEIGRNDTINEGGIPIDIYVGPQDEKYEFVSLRHFKWGGEVRVEVDIGARRMIGGQIEMAIRLRLYEGTYEETEDLDGEVEETFLVPTRNIDAAEYPFLVSGEDYIDSFKVKNSDEGGDWARVTLRLWEPADPPQGVIAESIPTAEEAAAAPSSETGNLFSASDINGDGQVDTADLVLISNYLGQPAPENPPVDVNGDGFVTIADLVHVAQYLGQSMTASAPVRVTVPVGLKYAMVEGWIDQARVENDGSFAFQQGLAKLEYLLTLIIPEKTALLPNYPNPFNPETWIPYHLAEPAEVTLTIYAIDGRVVRRLDLGHQDAGYYQSKSRAAYWDGRNAVGERVASGIYFYTLTVGDFAATKKLLIRK